MLSLLKHLPLEFMNAECIEKGIYWEIMGNDVFLFHLFLTFTYAQWSSMKDPLTVPK